MRPMILMNDFLTTVIVSTLFLVTSCSTDKTSDRVETFLQIDLKRIGTIKPRDTKQIESSRITIGCEVQDRDYTDFNAYKEYLQPLGFKKARLQAGWAKTEKEKGVYNFWLDDIIDYLVSIDISPWVQFSYGNPIYEGGGGIDLAGRMPVSEEALAAWDKWVEALVMRYKDRVFEWEVWNEPGNNRGDTPETCAELNIRTAEIVKRIQPEAKIAGLATGGDSEVDYLDRFLKVISDAGKLDLFTWITYHGYRMIPEDSYAGVEKLNAKLSAYSSKILLRQGEQGAPSGYCPSFALSKYNWTEYTQAKWDLRRCMGDLGRDIETAVYCIIDMAYRWDPVIMNIKGLIQSDTTKIAIRRKIAYYSMQHLASIFDNTLECTPGFKYSTNTSESISVFGFQNIKTQQQLVALWFDSSVPNNLFVTKDVMVTVENGNFKKPVWVDMLSGRIYEIPASKYKKEGTKYTFTVPVYDSPVLIADASLIPKFN